MAEKYPFEKIHEVVMMVRASNHNISKVAHETGVSRALVKLWTEKYGPTLWNAQPVVVPNPEKLVEAEILKTREDETVKIRQTSQRVCELIVQELKTRIMFADPPIPTSILVNIFKELAPYSMPKVVPDGGLRTETVEASLDEFISNFEDKLKQHNVSSTKIRVTRTTEG